jgi:hypothetical protein
MPVTMISTDIEIAAPPERVWAVLSDLEGYQAWNPIWQKVSGELTPGNTLTIIATPLRSDRSVTVKVTVEAAEPASELRWRSSVLGVSHSVHSFVLTRQGAGTQLEQRQVYRGFFTRFNPKTVGRIRASFEAINEAIKAQAEQP